MLPSFETTWANILAGKSGAKRIDDFEIDDIACQIACRIPLGAYADGKYDPNDWMDSKEQRKVDPFILFGMAAATMAIEDAGVQPKTQEEAERTAFGARRREWSARRVDPDREELAVGVGACRQRPGDSDPWWLRLHPRLSSRAVLPRQPTQPHP